MSSTPVALPAIFTSASVDSETLIRTACEAASVIEPWFSAKSEHPILQDLIPRVQNSALLFYDALDVSKKASMDGIRFAQDLSTFWDHLTDERTSTADLQKLIDSMTGTAGEAYNTAVFVSNRFEVASRDICTITNDVPLQLTSLADEEQYHKKKLVASEKKIRIVKGAKVTSSAAAAIVAVVAGAIFPPALIAFPIVLPLVTLVLEGTQIHLEKEMKKRETKLHKCTDAMDQLSRASGDLVKLKNCVDQFAYFWKHVEIALHVIKGRVEELRKDEHTRLQLSTLKNSCLRLEKSFFEYTAKMNFLVLCDPRHKPNELGTYQVESLSSLSPSTDLKRQESSGSLASQATLVNEDRFLGPPKPKGGSSRSSSSDSRHSDSSKAPQNPQKPSSDKDRGLSKPTSGHDTMRYREHASYDARDERRTNDRQRSRSRDRPAPARPHFSRDYDSSDDEGYPSPSRHYQRRRRSPSPSRKYRYSSDEDDRKRSYRQGDDDRRSATRRSQCSECLNRSGAISYRPRA